MRDHIDSGTVSVLMPYLVLSEEVDGHSTLLELSPELSMAVIARAVLIAILAMQKQFLYQQLV